MKYFSRIFRIPNQSFFLFGPRGTGKSTWLRRQFPDALWINLLEPDQLQFYGSFPNRLKEHIKAYPEKKVVIIDEVQKLPILLSIVHDIIEEKTGIQFILTGSSCRKLKRQGVDLLAGRALLRHMHPFIAAELGDDFDLKIALKHGLLPLVWNSEEPWETLSTYSALYLKEEVQAEGLVRNIGNFARFLEVISFSHTNVLNISNIARECDVSRTTVASYLHVLEDLLLGFQLPVFTKRAQRSLSIHPKFFIFDAGVFRALRPRGPMDKIEEAEGPALEGLVAQHLKVWVDSQRDKHEFAYWRTRSGLEVDFVIYGSKSFLAIEVKNTTRLSPRDTHGLEAFREEYPESKQLLIYRGPQRTLQKDILCIPCEEFFQKIRPEQPL